MRTIAIALVMLAGVVVSPVWAEDVPPVDLLPAPMFDGQEDCGEPCKKYPTVLEEGKGGKGDGDAATVAPLQELPPKSQNGVTIEKIEEPQ